MLRLKFTTCPTIKEATQVLNALINLVKQHMWLSETEDETDEMEDEAEVYQTDTHEEKWIKILHNESYYQVYVKLTEFKDIINKTHLFEDSENHSLLSINYTMLFKLMRKEMQLTSIPFHGEPAMGLQVMGVLETRCLDFKHVLMLSVGEGILPQRSSEDSFIPFIIRTAYGLTTYLRKTAVFAYYFIGYCNALKPSHWSITTLHKELERVKCHDSCAPCLLIATYRSSFVVCNLSMSRNLTKPFVMNLR